jgi:hypothetical protein
MTIEEFEKPSPGNHVASLVRRVSGSIKVARNGATSLLGRVPGTMNATRAGAHATTSALQTLPDSTLRWLSASSVGLGAGLYLAGKRRLVIAAGVAPALVMGVAIAIRPIKPVVPTEANS